jgi:TRAP-type C4-dicarboxylate transport system substrate-binding protein
MVKKFLIIFLLVASGSIPFFGLAHAAEKHIIKFATLAPEGSTWMRTMRGVESIIKEKSRGDVGFRVYPGGVAGDELDVLRKMRIGQIHAAAFSGVGFGEILPMVRVLDLPFLFRGYPEIDKVHEELESYFSESFLDKGFVLLSWAEVGNVHLFSKQPIEKVQDIARKKVWTWSGDPVAKETFTQMGTSPIPLSIADVLTSLNTGMIDTVYGPPLGAVALQWHRYLKFMTSLPLTHSTGALLISADSFRRIPEEHSRMVKSEIRQAMARLTLELREQNETAIQIIQKGGVTITPMPTGAELEAFYRIHDQVAGKLAGDLFPRDLLERINKILATFR